MNYQLELHKKNLKLIDVALDVLHTVSDKADILDREEFNRVIVDLIEATGGEIDGCSLCGSIPMTTNCNNARCQDR